MMIGRRPQPVIGKLAGSWGSGGSSASATSPRSPLDIIKIQSPKGPKRYDVVGGVGLGIVAALDKCGHAHSSHRRKPNQPVFASNQSGSSADNEEDYTFVTCHGLDKNNTTSTRVYYDDGGVSRNNNIGFDRMSVKKHGGVAFDVSPVGLSDDVLDFPDSDFLSACHMCRKALHGKDVYMYRGEKAFCSAECRDVEIVKDERKEKQKRNSELVASRSSTINSDHVSTALPYAANRCIFVTGILAT